MVSLMLGRVSLTWYPNREVRAIFTPEKQPSHRKTDESHNETGGRHFPVKAVTCHSLKTQNHPPSGGSGDCLNRRKKAGYGSVGRQSAFSNYARQQILRCGGALEHLYQPEQCLFLTMTLPGSTEAAKLAIAEWSAYLVDTFKSWLSKRVQSRHEMYVWEWQRRGALHLHYVIGCPDKAVGEEIRQSLRGQWIRLLDNVCEKSGVDVYAKNAGFSHKHNKGVVRVDAQWCEKSVAAYLSKYVSKESRKNRNRVNKKYYPSRWYGCSRPLLKLKQNLTKTVVTHNMRAREWHQSHEEILSVLQSTSLYCYNYRHNVGLGKSIVAYVENTVKDSIWTQIMMTIPSSQDLYSKSEETMMRILNRGMYLLNHNWLWRKQFTTTSSNYVKGLVGKLAASQPMTPCEAIFLLDTLVYTLGSLLSTRPYIPPGLKKWYSDGVELRQQCFGQSLSSWSDWTEVKLAQPPIDKSHDSEQAGTSPTADSAGTAPRA